MNIEAQIAAIETLPRLGWVDVPTPLTEHPSLAQQLGLDSLRIKRDDFSRPLCGSSKTRKLDYLLASEPIASAAEWVGVGAIGSGQLVSLVAAAKLLDRRVRPYMFWQEPTPAVLESLAYVASGPTELSYAPSRVQLALTWPRALVGSMMGTAAVVPPGGTSPNGTLGIVRGGLELARQLLEFGSPIPDRLYVPVGSGGTAVGIALGLGLGGLMTEVHAVSVVERPFLSGWMLRRLQRQTLELLGQVGLRGESAPLRIRRSFVGPGYGQGSDASRQGMATLRGEGVPGDDVYSGKAFACLVHDATQGTVARPLFWMTGRADRLEGISEDADSDAWHSRLPDRLRVRLEFDEAR